MFNTIVKFDTTLDNLLSVSAKAVFSAAVFPLFLIFNRASNRNRTTMAAVVVRLSLSLHFFQSNTQKIKKLCTEEFNNSDVKHI